MARLRSFGARAFGARVFIPVFGKINEQHSGTFRRITEAKKVDSHDYEDDDLTIALVCAAFTNLMVMKYV